MAQTETLETAAPATASGATYARTILVSTALVVILMTIDVVPDKTIDYIARAGLVLVALFGAIRARKGDFLAAIWTPVIAWFIALMTVGQITRPAAGSLKSRELVLILHGLADHAWWILGATALAAVVVAIRRSR